MTIPPIILFINFDISNLKGSQFLKLYIKNSISTSINLAGNPPLTKNVQKTLNISYKKYIISIEIIYILAITFIPYRSER